VLDTAGRIILFYLPGIIPPKLIVRSSINTGLDLILFQECGNVAAKHLEVLANKELTRGKCRWPNGESHGKSDTMSMKPGYLNLSGAYHPQGQVRTEVI
jgi:hypothetical protein